MNRQCKKTDLSIKREFGGVDIQVQRDSYIALNTFQLDMSLKLYHVFKYKHLIESLKNKCLFMKKPKDWEDCYDIFLLNTLAKDTDRSFLSLELIKNEMYFQCWSKTEENKPLWEARSLDGNIELVKIKTNVGKLINSLYDIKNPLHNDSYFISNVNYVDDETIDNLRGTDVNNYFMYGGEPMIMSLFLKRKKYEFENEVRLLFRAVCNDGCDSSDIKNRWNIKKDIFSFEIDVNDVIEEIVLHPGLDDDYYRKMKAEIIDLGYTGDIHKSTLYTRDNSVLTF
jgi:hypothetical protein